VSLAELPIDAEIPAIVRDLSTSSNRLVLQAPPGTGKSTRLAPALVKAIPGRTCLLQPRRSSTLLVARRIAEEQNWKVGEKIGYSMRFSHEYSDRTDLLVATHGSFLQTLVRDPTLAGVSVVLLDEFHERSLDLDLLSGLLLYSQKEVRPDLKIVWMSATLAAPDLARQLDAQLKIIEGRKFPVELRYSPARKKTQDPQADLQVLLKEALTEVYARNSASRTLVFLPGKREISNMAGELTSLKNRHQLTIRELHGSLELREQEEILRSQQPGEIILSTNLAETSVTLHDITAVVDSGFQKSLEYDPSSGREFLRLEKISSESAEQRAGRAGRTASGVCYRLWTEDEQRFLAKSQKPEILRRGLEGVLLRVLDAGFRNPAEFPWVTAPDVGAQERALANLKLLKLLKIEESQMLMTALGSRVLRWPVDLRWAVFLEDLAATAPQEIEAALRLVAFMESEGATDARNLEEVFERLDERNFTRAQREIFEDLKKRALTNFGQWDHGKGARDFSKLRLSLLRAFPDFLAKKREGSSDEALMVSRRGLRWRGGGPLKDYFLALDVQLRPDSKESALHRWVELDEVEVERAGSEWIRERFLRTETAGKIQFFKQKCFLDLPMAAPHGYKVAASEEATVLQDLLSSSWSGLWMENESYRQFLFRWRLAFPSENFPLSPERWVEALSTAHPGKLLDRKFLVETDFSALLPIASHLSYALQTQMEARCPLVLVVKNGRRRTLLYRDDGSVDVEVVLQDLLGWKSHPCVGLEKIPLRIHLLSPARRPIQVTKDLPGFWRSSYAEVRKELRGRYPRHNWPENPEDPDKI
jgi:ATP-dependent helicase HrpB